MRGMFELSPLSKGRGFWWAHSCVDLGQILCLFGPAESGITESKNGRSCALPMSYDSSCRESAMCP